MTASDGGGCGSGDDDIKRLEELRAERDKQKEAAMRAFADPDTRRALRRRMLRKARETRRI